MTTDRSYRDAMSTDSAIAELGRNAGSQFSPDVVEALIDVIDRDSPERDQPGSRGPALAGS